MRATLTRCCPSVPKFTSIQNARISSRTQDQVKFATAHQLGAEDDTIDRPSGGTSVTTRRCKSSPRGLIEIQNVTRSPGDASDRLTCIEASTKWLESPAAKGMRPTKAKPRTRTRISRIRHGPNMSRWTLGFMNALLSGHETVGTGAPRIHSRTMSRVFRENYH